MEALVRSWLAKRATTQQGGSQSTSSQDTTEALACVRVIARCVPDGIFAFAFTITTPTTVMVTDSSALLVAEHGENLWRDATSTCNEHRW